MDLFFLQCVECGDTDCATPPKKQVHLAEARFLDPLSPSNQKETSTTDSKGYFPKNVFRLCCGCSFESRPPVLVHQTELVKRQTTN